MTNRLFVRKGNEKYAKDICDWQWKILCAIFDGLRKKNMSYDIKILIVIKLFTSVCYLQKLLLPRTVYISNGNLYRFVPWMSTRISLTLFSFTCLIPLPLSTIRSVSEKIAKGKGLKIAYLRMSLYKNLYTYLTCLLDSIII